MIGRAFAPRTSTVLALRLGCDHFDPALHLNAPAAPLRPAPAPALWLDLRAAGLGPATGAPRDVAKVSELHLEEWVSVWRRGEFQLENGYELWMFVEVAWGLWDREWSWQIRLIRMGIGTVMGVYLSSRHSLRLTDSLICSK